MGIIGDFGGNSQKNYRDFGGNNWLMSTGNMYSCHKYSKTSNNGPSEKRTTSLQRTAHLPPIDFTIELIRFEPPRSGHLSTPNNGH